MTTRCACTSTRIWRVERRHLCRKEQDHRSPRSEERGLSSVLHTSEVHKMIQGTTNTCYRYGSQWAVMWRIISQYTPKYGNETTLEFGLDDQRTVTAVTGISRNENGNTGMVKATMSDGEEWTAGIQSKPHSGASWRPSPSSTPLVLSHLSGNINPLSRILRFHWRPQ